VVGEQERSARTVNVRTRDNHVHGMHKLDDVLQVLVDEKKNHRLESQWADVGNAGAPVAE
jgi:threonyl-tRNA synthetase